MNTQTSESLPEDPTPPQAGVSVSISSSPVDLRQFEALVREIQAERLAARMAAEPILLGELVAPAAGPATEIAEDRAEAIRMAGVVGSVMARASRCAVMARQRVRQARGRARSAGWLVLAQAKGLAEVGS